MQIFDSDLTRTDYPRINQSQPELAKVAGSTIQGRNPFLLCREVTRLARKIHNPLTSRMPSAITEAMKMISQPSKKRPAAIYWREAVERETLKMEEMYPGVFSPVKLAECGRATA